MSKRQKQFDCVEFKNKLQAHVREKNAGLTPEEAAARVTKWIEESDDSLARHWRGEQPVEPDRVLRPGDPFFKRTAKPKDFDCVEFKRDLQAKAAAAREDAEEYKRSEQT